MVKKVNEGANSQGENTSKKGSSTTNQVHKKTSTTKIVSVNDLTTHPLLRQLYSSSESEQSKTLKDNINKFGLINNIIVDKDLQILSGARRWSALSELGYEKTVVIIKDIAEDDVLEFGISSNQSREKTIMDERNEVKRLFEKYSAGQGKAAGGQNTIKQISMITGMSTDKVSKIRLIEEQNPYLFDKIKKGMSLHAASKKATVIKERKVVCETLGKEYQPVTSVESEEDAYIEDVAEVCKAQGHPELVEEIENGSLTPKEAFEEATMNVTHKRKTPKTTCECPFCSSKVTDQIIQRRINQWADEIEQLTNKMNEVDITPEKDAA